MIPATFTAQISSARELCQLDYNRKIIPRDKQTMFCAEVTIECTSGDKDIDLEFLVRTEVKLSRVTALSESRKKTEAVAFLIAKEGIPQSAKSSHLEIYRGVPVHLSGETPIPTADESYRYQTEEVLNVQLATQLREATKRHRDTATRFEEAKQYLHERLDSLRHDKSGALFRARFLAECMRKSGSPFMAAWNHEKAFGLVDNVEDLTRRKNPSHPNYTRTAENIRSLLFNIQPEKLWHESPP